MKIAFWFLLCTLAFLVGLGAGFAAAEEPSTAAPRPSTARPPLMTSSVVVILASNAGLRWVTAATSAPIVAVLVRAASAPSNV